MYSPTFAVLSSVGATIGNGTLTGRFRVVGDSVEIEQFLKWGSTTSFGAAATPSVIVEMPPGKTPDISKMLTDAGAGLAPTALSGIVAAAGGAAWAGASYTAAVANIGGVKIFLSLHTSFASVIATGDKILMKTSVPFT
jgi:hypothetical protein